MEGFRYVLKVEGNDATNTKENNGGMPMPVLPPGMVQLWRDSADDDLLDELDFDDAERE